jgi:hypothetical protein
MVSIMDTTNLPNHPRLLLSKRHLLFLAIGGVLGILLDYFALPPNNPIVSIALGIGLLAAAAIGRSMHA